MSDITKLNDHIYLLDAFYYAYPRRGAVYLVQYDGEVALIDTGTAMSVVYIMDVLNELKIAPAAVRYLLPTHVHLDHAGGAGVLAQRLPNAEIYVHPRGLRHLIDPTKLVAGSRQVYGDDMMDLAIGAVSPIPAARSHEAVDMQELPLGKTSLRLLFSPGHAYHHYSIWDQRTRTYFAGDIAGNSYREMDKGDEHLMFLCSAPVQYDPVAWHTSLNAISELNPASLCICHYGVLHNVSQAVADMHRLLDEVNEQALKHLNAENKYPAMERVAWEGFWREYERLSPAIERLHAEVWMKKDIHISAAGLAHWLEIQAKEN